jgi:transporter family protein
MVFVVGSQNTISGIDNRSLTFLVLSGLATGASWLCYFKALKLGDINKVVPIDKSSVILTMILAIIILGESFTLFKLICMILIGTGTLLMTSRTASNTGESDLDIPKNHTERNKSIFDYKNSWIVYAILAAVFAALTSILGKIGISEIDATLGTAIRTLVVLILAWIIVFIQGVQKELKHIDRKSQLFLILSGLATGACWICFYTALQLGPASIVVPIDKLSIVITIFFGVIIFKEKLYFKSISGLVLILTGTILLLFT